MKKFLRSALATLLTLCLLYGVAPAMSAAEGATVTFTDAVLESKVRAELGIPQGPISMEIASKVENLNLSSAEGLDESQVIHDIGDLRQFPNISWLNLIDNALTDISALSGLANLKGLDIGGNAITDLSPLSGLPLLELNIWGNGITDISMVSTLASLERLTANNNLISDFSPLAGLTHLKALYLGSNASGNFSALAGIAAQLEEKDFEILSTPFDPAEVITFADPVLERRVRAFMNLPDGPLTAGDAAYATVLDLSNQWGGDVPASDRFTDISPLRYFVNLTELYLTRNSVQDISALAQLTRLKVLQMADNDVLDFAPLAGLTQLTNLSIDSKGRDISMLGNLTALDSLDIGNGNLTLPDWLPKLKQLTYVGATGGEISDLGILAQCPQLTAVNLGWNRISDITPLTGLRLTRLYLNGNQIHDLTPLAGMPLTCLFLENNPIMSYSPIHDVYDTLQEKDFEALFADDIPEEPLTFADPNFEKALRDAMNIHDRPITTRDAYPVTRLEVYRDKVEGAEFADISPLKAFVNLQELRVNASIIRDLSPLSGLTQLTGLFLSFQNISDLSPLAGLTQLRWLYLRSNQIVDLSPLRGLTQLDTLDISNNQVADLTPLQGLTNLKKLFVEGNAIVDFSPTDALMPNLQETDIPSVPDSVPDAPLPDLDANLAPLLAQALGIPQEALTQRRVYRISQLALGAQADSQITAIDISALAYFQNLQRLDIVRLPVSDLTPLVGLPKLRWLVVADAALTDITPVAQMTGLNGLEVQGNQIVDVSPIAALADLDFLNVSNNRITDLRPLLGLGKLGTLFMSGNPAGDISAFADIASRLVQKDFDVNTPLEAMPDAGAQANEGYLVPDDPTETVKFKDKKLEASVRAILGIQGRDITLADTYAVTTLDFTQVEGGDKKFSDISPLAAFVNLEELRLVGNGIKNIKALAGLTRLRSLQLDMQAIADIAPLAAMVKLDYLSVKESKIASIKALAGLAELRCLDMSGNKIKDLAPLATCTALEELYLSKNQIADLTPLAQCAKLKTLHLVKNKIKDVSALAALPQLQGLMLGENKIKDFSVLSAIFANLTDTDVTLP